MADPIVVSKAAHANFPDNKWNAFVDLVLNAPFDELTPIQRIAHLACWYSSEVLNGGHDQYFGNKDYFDHAEVIAALGSIGADCQCKVLRQAWAYYLTAEKERPNDYDQYIVWEREWGYESQMSIFDQAFYDCRPEIETELLENYLNSHEHEFIKWVL